MAQNQPYDPYEDEDDPLTDAWIPPGASFGNNASGAINNQNPTADPDKPFVQAGTTGGYIDGIGETLGAGTSMTQGRFDSEVAAARAAGVPEGWIQGFLQSNGKQDAHRITEGWRSDNGNAPANSGMGEAASVYTQGGSGGGGQAGSGGGGTAAQASSGDSALAAYLSTLQTRDAEARAQQDQMRKILMEQLTLDQQPISADSPGIREVLAGSRLGLQRGAERQRQGAAELRAYDGSGGLGGKAFESDVNRIEQQQAESDSMMTGEVLNRELTQKQQRLTQRLALAMQLGDAESARLIQSQLQAIQTQLSQGNFKDRLGFDYTALEQDDSHFNDNSAFNYASLNQSGNLAALMAILGAA